MSGAIARLWRHHRAALIGFVLAACVTLFFAVRFMLFTVYWSDPAHRNEPPQPWMTIGYVAHSWKMPPETVANALGISTLPDRRVTLGELATSMGVSEEILMSRLKAALAKLPAPQKP